MNSTLTRKHKASFWLFLLPPLLAVAADMAPATLPKGFLEKLPVLSKLNDNEFNQLLALAKSEQAEKYKAVKVSEQQGREQ